MMRTVPTPARASREATADPVAPQPTIGHAGSRQPLCPSAPMPRKRICREYRSSCSKDITNLKPRNHYYKSRVSSFRLRSASWRRRRHAEARAARVDNVAFQPFIETVNHPTGRGVFLRARATLCIVAFVWLLPLLASAQQTPPPHRMSRRSWQQAAQTPNPALGAISRLPGPDGS